MRRKKVFLFVFLICLFFGFFNINYSYSQVFGTGPNGEVTVDGRPITNFYDDEAGNRTVYFSDGTIQTYSGAGLNHNQNTGSTAGDKTLNILTGINALGLRIAAPFIALFAGVASIITALVVGIMSYIFNLAMEIGVLGISQLASSPAIKLAWEVFRNLGNLALVFIILFIAIKTILGAGGYKTGELLGKVIFAGVLMNFSFFFGAIIVDISNVISLNIYDEIRKETSASGTQNTGLGGYFFEKSASTVIWMPIVAGIDENANTSLQSTVANNALKLLVPIGGSTINLIRGFSSLKDESDKDVIYAIGLTLATIVNLVLACVLAIASFMIIARLITILFLLAVSPIAFVSMILPNTEKTSKEWWDSIIGQAFFLPVFLIFIWMSIKIIDLYSTTGFAQSFGQTNAVETGFFDFSGLIKMIIPAAMQFILVIGLLLASVKFAKDVSSKTSGLAGKISASVTSNVGGAVLGSTAFLGRNTIGAAANKVKELEKLKEFARRNPVTGSLVLRGLEGTAKSNFDLRNTKPFKGVASATGIGKDFNDILKSGKDGFVGQTERFGKTIEKTLKIIPDRKDDHAEVAPHKSTFDTAKSDFDTKAAALKDLDKKVKSGTLTKTHSSYTAAVAAKEAAELTLKDAENKYKEAKNPVKFKFVNTPPPLSGPKAWVNNVANVWVGESKEKAKSGLKHVKTDAEKDREELIKALKESLKDSGGDKK